MEWMELEYQFDDQRKYGCVTSAWKETCHHVFFCLCQFITEKGSHYEGYIIQDSKQGHLDFATTLPSEYERGKPKYEVQYSPGLCQPMFLKKGMHTVPRTNERRSAARYSVV